MPAPVSTIRSLRFHAGETRLLQLDAGTRVVVQDGRLACTPPPRWLGEQLHHTSQILEAGVPLQLEEGGWTSLRAASDGTLLIVPPPAEAGLLPTLLASLRQLRQLELGWLRRERQLLQRLLGTPESPTDLQAVAPRDDVEIDPVGQPAQHLHDPREAVWKMDFEGAAGEAVDDAPRGVLGRDQRSRLRVVPGAQRCGDEAGVDQEDRHTPRCEVEIEDLGKVDQRRLARPVGQRLG
jgi:hypothetical protein